MLESEDSQKLPNSSSQFQSSEEYSGEFYESPSQKQVAAIRGTLRRGRYNLYAGRSNYKSIGTFEEEEQGPFPLKLVHNLILVLIYSRTSLIILVNQNIQRMFIFQFPA